MANDDWTFGTVDSDWLCTGPNAIVLTLKPAQKF
jgi:hypothetical protein